MEQRCMKKILVVDDDIKICEMIKSALEEERHFVIDTASNGLIAMDMISKNDYALVIMDIVMPEQDGIATLLKIVKSHSNIKFITISGGGKIKADTYLDMTKNFDCVINTFEKPFDIDELLNAVIQAVDES